MYKTYTWHVHTSRFPPIFGQLWLQTALLFQTRPSDFWKVKGRNLLRALLTNHAKANVDFWRLAGVRLVVVTKTVWYTVPTLSSQTSSSSDGRWFRLMIATIGRGISWRNHGHIELSRKLFFQLQIVGIWGYLQAKNRNASSFCCGSAAVR